MSNHAGQVPFALRRRTLGGLAAALLAAPAFGQGTEAFPNRPVRLVVGFPPGGGADTVARILSQPLARILGRSCVVENRPGANGRIGAELVARAPADGHTLLVSPEGAIVIAPYVTRNLAYDPLRDLQPVSLLTRTATMLVATSSLPVQSVADLLALARARPEEVFFGSSGVGGPNHLAGVVFQQLTGVRLTHVPYNGTGAVMPAVVSGQVGLMFGFVSGLAPLVRQGSVRPLAVGSPTRLPALPDVPTMAEAGVPGYDLTSWIGAFTAAGTPAAILSRLHAAIAEAFADTATHRLLAEQGLDPAADPPAAFSEFLQTENRRYGALLTPLNIRE
jgi:tripartite-type tricarboxylate transporter receptor subunit TctC